MQENRFKKLSFPRGFHREAKKENLRLEQVNKLYVGNLDYNTTEDEIKNFFAEKGIETKTVTLITDKYTGRAKGFGFVEVDDADLDKAVSAMNGQKIGEREIVVNEARPKTDRPRGDRNDRPRRDRF